MCAYNYTHIGGVQAGLRPRIGCNGYTHYSGQLYYNIYYRVVPLDMGLYCLQYWVKLVWIQHRRDGTWGIQNSVKICKNQVILTRKGKRVEVPAIWLSCKDRSFKLTNRPHSAGMGPGAYKTQSKHTTNKPPIRLVRKGKRKASLFLHIECKSGERGMEYR